MARANDTYLVRATDSSQNFVDALLLVTISSGSVTATSHKFVMDINTDYTLFTQRLVDTVWWLGNVTSYFGSPLTSLTVQSIEEGSLLIRWFNNTIVGPYTCPLSSIRQIESELSSQAFRDAMALYLIKSVAVELVGICSETATTTSLFTSPTMQLSTTKAPSTMQQSTTVHGVGSSDALQTTGGSRLAQSVAIPLVLVIVVLVVLVVIIIFWRRRRRYQGHSRFDEEGNPFGTIPPAVQVEEPGDQFDELYADEGIENMTYIPSSYPGERAAPPIYLTPPSFPAGKQKKSDYNEVLM